MDNMFEQAARIGIRYPTPQGFCTTEELWGLPLTSNSGRANLDDLAKELNRQIKDSAEESFVAPASKISEELELGFAIVKHVIGTRLVENAAKAEEAANRAKKQRILELIAEKRDGELSNKSVEELEQLAAAL